MSFDDDALLGEARAWLWDRAVGKGDTCPCCGQFAKVYRRAMSSGTARVMIALYRHDEGRDWIYLTPLMNELSNHHQIGGYGTLAHWWGLMEQQLGDRDDGSWRNGYWRLTDLGRKFVVGDVTVPKYAWLFDGECLGISGEPWSIIDALGKRFGYRELMDG